MTPFEEELRRALARREPPEDFTARVLARAAGQAASGRWSWLRWTRMRVLTAVAALVLLPVGANVVYQRHERTVRGEAAKQKLLVALQIAGAKLHDARQQVMEIER